jgi:hypothetical protein
MIRHRVVRKAKQHAVKRHRRRERRSIALHQLDIVPAIGVAGFLRLAQHAGRNINAVNAPGRPYRFVQIAEASAVPQPTSSTRSPALKPRRSTAFLRESFGRKRIRSKSGIYVASRSYRRLTV